MQLQSIDTIWLDRYYVQYRYYNSIEKEHARKQIKEQGRETCKAVKLIIKSFSGLE